MSLKSSKKRGTNSPPKKSRPFGVPSTRLPCARAKARRRRSRDLGFGLRRVPRSPLLQLVRPLCMRHAFFCWRVSRLFVAGVCPLCPPFPLLFVFFGPLRVDICSPGSVTCSGSTNMYRSKLCSVGAKTDSCSLLCLFLSPFTCPGFWGRVP